MVHLYRVTSKGQITLPKNVRELLQVSEGDYLTYRIENGRVYLEKANLIPNGNTGPSASDQEKI
jgi:AbrB family looped-hinge helix DNA binding protein